MKMIIWIMRQGKQALVMLCLCLLSCSCGHYWRCYVDAMGTDVPVKTYYIENHFPDNVNPLLTEEYNSYLEKVLAHRGYARVDSANASLKMVFGYVVEGFSAVQKTDFVATYLLGFPVSSSEMMQKIEIKMDACDVKTDNILWSVSVTDMCGVSYIQNLRRWMPYYLLSAEPFIGKNSDERKSVIIKMKDKRLREFSLFDKKKENCSFSPDRDNLFVEKKSTE